MHVLSDEDLFDIKPYILPIVLTHFRELLTSQYDDPESER
jgi:hypothetical protein